MAELERIEVERIERNKYRFYRVLASEDRQAGHNIVDAHLLRPANCWSWRHMSRRTGRNLSRKPRRMKSGMHAPGRKIWKTWNRSNGSGKSIELSNLLH